jgi:hypothetical protein
MRTNWNIAALSLALLLGACGRRQEQTAGLPDDLKKDLAAASVPGSDLALSRQSYQRMRFVSDIEQWKGGVPAKGSAMAHHAVRSTARHRTATQPAVAAPNSVVSMASESPATVSTPAAPTPEPPTVIAQRPSPEPMNMPAGSTSEGTVGDGGHGGGLGGLLGGLIGAVIIRGGRGGVDHCDPRTDGRARPTVIDRPDFGLPLPTGQPFPGSRRR